MKFIVDIDTRTLEIDGVKMSLEMLKLFTFSTAPGIWFRVERKGDEVVIHQRLDKEDKT